MILRAVKMALPVLITAAHLCGREIPVLTVCEVLSHPTVYAGKSIIVVGKYRSWMEGTVLGEDCHSKPMTEGHEWPSSIWLESDGSSERTPVSGLWLPNYRVYKTKIMSKLPERERSKLRVVVDGDYSDNWAAVYGRLETRDPFPLLRGHPVGFGHLGMYPAQLVSPRRATWCLVPKNEYFRLFKAEKERLEESRRSVWRNLKASVLKPGGLALFDTQMKNQLMPPMIGTVSAVNFQQRPNMIVLVMPYSSTAEVVLQVDPPVRRKVTPGTQVEFEGIPIACTTQPFMMTLSVAASKLRMRAGPFGQ